MPVVDKICSNCIYWVKNTAKPSLGNCFHDPPKVVRWSDSMTADTTTCKEFRSVRPECAEKDQACSFFSSK